MNTIHLNDAELAMVRHAMHTYLTSFGHDEHDVVEQVKRIMAKLNAASSDDSGQRAS